LTTAFHELSPDEQDLALERLAGGAPLGDLLRAAVVSPEVLLRVLACCGTDPGGRAVLRSADLSDATFGGTVDLRDVRFEGDALFDRVTVEGDLILDGAEFDAALSLPGGVVARDLSLCRVRLAGPLRLGDARIGGSLDLDSASLGDDADLERIGVKGNVELGDLKISSIADVAADRSPLRVAMTVAGDLELAWAEVGGYVNLVGCHIGGTLVNLSSVKVGRDLDVNHLTGSADLFVQYAEVGGDLDVSGCQGLTRIDVLEAKVGRHLNLARTVVDGAVVVNAATVDGDLFLHGLKAKELSMVEARVEGRTLGDAAELTERIGFDDARFEGVMRLTATAPNVRLAGTTLRGGGSLRISGGAVDLSRLTLAGPLEVSSPQRVHPVRITSLANADLNGPVTIGAGIDMSDCRFRNTPNLQYVRLVGGGALRLTAGRQMILEEREWRDDDRDPEGPGPAEIAGLYRQLRKNLEDSKDSPGAADFYYGEMEMRRESLRGKRGPRAKADFAILTSYWAFSGYGLRAWRAFTTLAVTIVVGAFAYRLGGFSPHAPDQELSSPETLLFAIRSAVSFVSPPDAENGLTFGEDIVQLVLRFAGPILLGLGALSLRSRIQR
jgi:hypothetical protein